MSHYRPYPVYKDSGVEWLGRVPEHWALKPFKVCIDFQEGPGIMATDFREEGIPLLRVSGVQGRWASLDGCNFLDPIKVAKQWDHFRLKSDDLLISASASMGTVCEVAEDTVGAIAYTGLIRLRGRTGVIVKPYVRAQVISSVFTIQIELFKAGSTIQHFGPTHLSQMLVVCPPTEEQQAIAVYIDRETARIDGLVEKKNRFIELLREKRQALITHAVTKGLDPNVKMKDSGVEWLGEVPEHWGICKLSFRYSVELGKMLDEKKLTKTSLVPYLRNQDVQWESINIQDLPEMDIHPGELERYTVRKGDLMVCEGGDVGRAAIWMGENGTIGYQKALHRLRPRSPVTDTAEFFFFSLLTAKKRGVFEESDSKATIAHLPAEKFRQYRFAFPPKPEQIEITDHVRIESKRLDALLSKTELSIALLKERRSALITAAVTGQIDLREAV
ncbi:MAG: restriction endonuclease subunit S [Pseudomonadales bacterium RIFCSPLOWO2_12_59_9]|nr:MAG: restriction endonuclease subunit S [Pseudomonadales bacterium RIFCSPLOWO2_12_59_9]